MIMELYLSTRYDDGLCLVTTDGFSGLTNITFPDDLISVKKYKEWYEKPLNNVVSITDTEYPPQWIYKSSISSLSSVNNICKNALEPLDLKADDVTVPILGNVKGYDFREMITRLWDSEDTNHYNYAAVISSYYTELFEKILEEKESGDT